MRASIVTTVIAAVSVLAGATSAIAATPTLTLSVGADPIESVATQLSASGTVTTTTEDRVYMTVKPSGGRPCGANYAADDGTGVVDYDYVQTGPYIDQRNWTFGNAGSYILCGWLTDPQQSNNPVVASATLAISVRIPKLTLTIGAPASVLSGETFQVTTVAQAEAQRPAYVGAISDTGRGCPANWNAAGFETIEDYLSVTGGPITDVKNVSLDTPGPYLLCGYFQYQGPATPPEATAVASVTVEAPCVVPAITPGSTVAAARAQLAAAHCSSTLTYAASRNHPRGTVVSTIPKAGNTLPTNTKVKLVVSTGAPCVVPHVVGHSLSSVKAALAAADCTVGTIKRVHSRHKRDTVTALRPSPGQHLSPRAPVAISVSSGHR